MTFGSNKGKSQVCNIVDLGVNTKEGPNRMLSVSFICEPIVRPIKFCVERYPYLNDIDLADSPSDSSHLQPEILIGLDYYWNFVTGEILCQGDGVVALHTTLGWVLSGPVPLIENTLCSTTLTTHVLRVGTTMSEDSHLKSFWDLESLGILDT